MTHLPIWYLGEIPVEECDKAFSELIEITPKDATMGVEGEAKDHLTRNTSIRFAEHSHWFGKQLLECGNLANSICKWEYQVNNYESIQFAEYGVGQHYHWHVDNFPLSGNPVERKITVICIMNDPSEWEGGDLQFRLYQEYTPQLKKGSIIAFPSIIEHRVLPVTKGIRYSATMWINGPRFK
jgi:PKHD-type hydroxylase